MGFLNHRGSIRLRRATLTLEQLAAAYRHAVEWREEWRAEIGASELQPEQEPEVASARPPKSTDDDGMHRVRFANAIARAEFGRFYWDGRQVDR